MVIEPVVYPLLAYLLSVIGLYPIAVLLEARLVAKQVVEQNHFDKCQWRELGLTLAKTSLHCDVINTFCREK